MNWQEQKKKEKKKDLLEFFAHLLEVGMSSALVEYQKQVSLYELSLLDMKARPKIHQRFKMNS
jgi:hypothetical protein